MSRSRAQGWIIECFGIAPARRRAADRIEWVESRRAQAAQREMGAGIAASPHLRRDMDLPVFASLTTRGSSALRSWLTRSGVASDDGPARRQVRHLLRPFLGWSLRVACPQGSRELRLEDQLFRRLFRWSDLGRNPPHRHPVEIGPSATCRSFERRGLPSRSPL